MFDSLVNYKHRDIKKADRQAWQPFLWL